MSNTFLTFSIIQGTRVPKPKQERARGLSEFEAMFAQEVQNFANETQSATGERVHYEFSVQGLTDSNGRPILTNFPSKEAAEIVRNSV